MKHGVSYLLHLGEFIIAGNLLIEREGWGPLQYRIYKLNL